MAGAARELAGRLRAAAAGGRRRSEAAIRERLARHAVPGSPFAADSGHNGNGLAGPGDPAAESRSGESRPEQNRAAEPPGAEGPGAHGPGAEGPGAQGWAAEGPATEGPATENATAAGHSPRPSLAAGGGAGGGAGGAEALGVPGLLLRAAMWSLCLLLVAAVAYLAFKVADALRLFVLPLIAALLLTALLQPLTAWLRRRLGMPALAATWCTLIAGIVVIAGVVMLITNRIQADYPRLAAEVRRTIHESQAYLAGPPFRLSDTRLQQLTSRLLNYLAQHKTLVAGTVLTGGRYFLEVLTGIILTIFITFFLLNGGRGIWEWLIKGLSREARARAGLAGDAAWHALVSYVRGTTAVAAIHALFIGLALWLLGVPLLVPLVMLVFLAAYVPLIGILVVGALAILVTLATKGWIAAVILLVVFLAENQLESHLLQPLLVGRIVRLHPLAVIAVLAVGGIVAGIPGAIVAVPIAAVVYVAWPYLRGKPSRGPAPGPAPAAPGPAPPVTGQGR